MPERGQRGEIDPGARPLRGAGRPYIYHYGI